MNRVACVCSRWEQNRSATGTLSRVDRVLDCLRIERLAIAQGAVAADVEECFGRSGRMRCAGSRENRGACERHTTPRPPQYLSTIHSYCMGASSLVLLPEASDDLKVFERCRIPFDLPGTRCE